MEETVNVLLVDDTPSNLMALEAILDEPFYKIFTATSGAEALLLMEQHNFAVVLLDVMMPVMDGFEVAKHIRKVDTSRFTPIVFLTALATEEIQARKGCEVGAIDYLQMPIDTDVVRYKVAAFVEMYRKNVQLENQIEQSEILKAEVVQRARIEAELTAAKDAAEALSLGKSKFLATMSHELRTPLSAIMGFANLLNEPGLPANERREFVGIIQRNGRLLTKLIDDILDLSRFEAGMMRVEKADC